MSDTPQEMPNLFASNLTEVLGQPDPLVVDLLQPRSLRPHKTLLGSIEALYPLPFASASDIYRSVTHDDHSEELTVVENAQFPTSRLIGAQVFESWAGRGYYKGKIVLKAGQSSARVIHDYSHQHAMWCKDPIVSLVKDIDGEVWGYIGIDGAHRSAATKLRNDEYLKCTVHTVRYNGLPKLGVSISESILRYGYAAQRLGNRIHTQTQIIKLAVDSTRVDRTRKT